MNIDSYQAEMSPDGIRVAIVVARWNKPICDGLLKGATDELTKLGVADDDVLIVSVAE